MSESVIARVSEENRVCERWRPHLQMIGDAVCYHGDCAWQRIDENEDLGARRAADGGWYLRVRIAGKFFDWDRYPNLAHMICQPVGFAAMVEMMDNPPDIASDAPRPSPGDLWAASIGRRYVGATFETFEQPTDAHVKAFAAVAQFAAKIGAGQALAGNLVLCGPVGAGKDHLLIAAGRYLRDTIGVAPVFTFGANLYAEVIGSRWDDAKIRRYANCQLLIVSDPVGAERRIGRHQAEILYRIVNDRNVALLPTWVSVNATNQADAIDRLGDAITDRLRDGAVIVPMPLASYRQPQ